MLLICSTGRRNFDIDCALNIKIHDLLLEHGGLRRVRDYRIHERSFSWLSFLSLSRNKLFPEQQTLGAGAFF